VTRALYCTGNHEERIEPSFYSTLLRSIPLDGAAEASRTLLVIDLNNINTADIAAAMTPTKDGVILKLVSTC